MAFQLVVLGSGQDGGTPQFGQPNGHVRRTASSVAVIGDGLRLLFDVSPDVRMQTERLWSGDRSPNGSAVRRPFDAVFLTHAHMGHYAGLVHFGRESIDADRIPLHASPELIDYLSANEPWASLFLNANLLAEPMTAAIAMDRLGIERVPVPHRAEHSDTSAFSVSIDAQPWLLYLPDIDAWEEWPNAEDVIARHRIAVLDATFGDPHELPGRDLSEIPHPFVAETIDRFQHLADHSTLVLSHINHSNALNDPDSDLARRAVEAGFVIASDGLVLDAGR